MCYLVTWQRENGNPSFHTKCRKCLECRQEKARESGLRNMLEQDEQGIGCFITLTYKTNPVVLLKQDLKNFKKRLRRHIEYYYDIKIKTFDCGEYGDKSLRPHFHMLIHGFDFPDKYEQGSSKRGHTIYNSETLEKLWGHGLVTIQTLTMSAAAYCALYAAKPTKFLPEHLQKHPEFNTQSQGLGMKHILENMETYLITDEIWYDGRKFRIPQLALEKYFKTELQLHRSGALPLHKTEKGRQYLALKERRREKGAQMWNSQLSQLDGDALEMYSQKQIRAIKKKERLTNGL